MFNYVQKRKKLFGDIEIPASTDNIDNLFDDFMDMTFGHKTEYPVSKDYDFKAGEDRLVWEFPLPKFKKKDVSVSYNTTENRLTIFASRILNKEEKGWCRNMKTEYRQSFNLKDYTVDDKYISAQLDEGVLTVVVPAVKGKSMDEIRLVEIK